MVQIYLLTIYTKLKIRNANNFDRFFIFWKIILNFKKYLKKWCFIHFSYKNLTNRWLSFSYVM